ncbi:restriction endonuclease subunit S [Lacticaseibacillus manihotivorans]|uniref:Type I restriction modification DNA specificity domain-containing protein n=2 Tax=Lacticaseibacillus manihotivorans TaxID=88233 RepID=A0A0R1R9I8_9LACO|nr:restriction endonuclease subunit S [Lacticaseibacillus manihotivorans]KRL53353.1 hypothetical protein FD01_GL000999 [Lacticaseibacillus manihotivorans DSM 13343 = JCM 12514]
MGSLSSVIGGQSGFYLGPNSTIDSRVRAKYQVHNSNFEIQSIFQKLKFNNLKYKAGDLPSHPTQTNPLPALTAGIVNQGLNNYVPVENATIFKNVISVSANGANTGVMFYQTRNFTVLQDAYAIDLIHKPKHIDKGYLFLVGALQKSVRFKFDWSNKAGWERIKTSVVTLPVHHNGSIAFDYMEAYIKELEAERIKELEAYLVATGLNDYVLSDEEKRIVSDFRNGGVRWSKFFLEDIFEIRNTTNIIKSQISNFQGGTPYVGASRENNGIGSYIDYDRKLLMDGNSLFIGGKTLTVFYQPKDYFSNDSHNLWLKLKHTIPDESHSYQFIAACMYKALSGKYEWGNSISRAKIRSDKLLLPVTTRGLPDYALMSRYTHVIEKLAIRGVVEWKDKQVAATKRVVNLERRNHY